MSLLDQFLAAGVASLGSSPGASITNTATSQNEIAVNPSITSFNLVDLTPLENIVHEALGVSQAQQAPAVAQAGFDIAEAIKWLASAVVLAFAIHRYKGG